MIYIRDTRRFKRNMRRVRAQLRRPWNGQYAREWQIGPLVFFWMHDTDGPKYGIHLVYKLRVWRDRYWWSHRKYSEHKHP